MDPPVREIPVTVPVTADSGATGSTGDVTVAPVTGNSALDTQPDARTAAPKPAAGGAPSRSARNNRS